MKKLECMSETPLFMDFAIALPAGLEIESENQARDCATYGGGGVCGCDDD